MVWYGLAWYAFFFSLFLFVFLWFWFVFLWFGLFFFGWVCFSLVGTLTCFAFFGLVLFSWVWFALVCFVLLCSVWFGLVWLIKNGHLLSIICYDIKLAAFDDVHLLPHVPLPAHVVTRREHLQYSEVWIFKNPDSDPDF